jgi:predicted nucleotidyltransferase
MRPYTWATCSKVIQAEVSTLQTELRRLLGQNLFGIYLHGSLALGGFHPTRGDIDVIVVIGQRMDLETKRTTMTSLLRISKMPCPLDIHFVVEHDLFPFQHPLPCDLHYRETLRETYQKDLRDGSWNHWNDGIQYDPDLTAHLVVLHQCGICLAGKPLAEVFPLVPELDFRAAIVNDVQEAQKHPLQDLISFVLNACRVLAYLHESTILSKDAGGTWGLAHLPAQYHPLIYQALALYQGERPRRPVGYAALDDFIVYIHEAMLPPQVLKVTTPQCSCKRKRVCVDDKRLRDEEAAYEDEAMARWLDDGGTSDRQAAYARHAFLPVIRML